MTTIITSTATQGNRASYADVHVNHVNMYVVVCQMIGPGQGSTLRRTRQKAGTEKTVRGAICLFLSTLFFSRVHSFMEEGDSLAFLAAHMPCDKVPTVSSKRK